MKVAINVSLENEMDLTLAYKKSIKLAEQLGLTVATQTTFATAVSEVCREVIDKAIDGLCSLGVITEDGRFSLTAHITFVQDGNLNSLQAGFSYARKLIPVFDVLIAEQQVTVSISISIPRSARLTPQKLHLIYKHFDDLGPISPYEEVKFRNMELYRINQQKELELIHANYLNDQKNEFLSVASHELRTPLTILKSYVELAIQSAGNQNESLTKYLAKIDLQTIKLQTLIQQLLDISKMETGQADYNYETVDLNKFITESAELIRKLVPNHELKVNLGEAVKVRTDVVRMEQVLNNLISNAAKYSVPGTCIDLETFVAGKEVVVSVRDCGIGMSEETIKRVFDKFYRADEVKNHYNGFGMGLYIASKIIDDHDGKITVESEEGKGSVFRFSIPILPQDTK
ncbi:MAG: sensor histidine kinase [Bacteroidota bacterium]